MRNVAKHLFKKKTFLDPLPKKIQKLKAPFKPVGLPISEKGAEVDSSDV